MLMMKRRQGESILIGEDIEIHLAHIGRTRVKIGINAPRHLAVVAKEVKVVGNENRAAAQAASAADLSSLVERVRKVQGPESRPDKRFVTEIGNPESDHPDRHEAGN
jgi:carbon storage regulator